VSVDFSANPDQVLELLTGIAMQVRNSEEFKDVFVADPQILGVDAVKGSEIIFPVIFKTLPTEQYAPVREFRRLVRLALEEHHLLPGDPDRIFNSFLNKVTGSGRQPAQESTSESDPTTNKAPDSNPFSGQ
jgi:small conductance mechanosensitive channel